MLAGAAGVDVIVRFVTVQYHQSDVPVAVDDWERAAAEVMDARAATEMRVLVNCILAVALVRWCDEVRREGVSLILI